MKANNTVILAAAGLLAVGAVGATIAVVKLAPAPQITVNANSSADENFTYTETRTETRNETTTFTEYLAAPPVAPVYGGNAGSAPVGFNVAFQMEVGGPLVGCGNCTVTSRINANGHKVYDVRESNGYIRTVVLWDDGSAEVFAGAKNAPKTRKVGTWTRRSNMAHVTLTGTFAFAL